MKTSLARTFKNIADGDKPSDRLYPTRISKYDILDENGNQLAADDIVVLTPILSTHDSPLEDITSSEVLLAKSDLRGEYDTLNKSTDQAKKSLFKEIKTMSGLKTDVEEQLATALTGGSSQEDVYTALGRLQKEVESQTDAPFATLPYNTVFNDRVLQFFKDGDVKAALDAFISEYNKLISGSLYFQRGTFEYYNAEKVAQNLRDQGFFKAKHFVTFSGKTPKEIKSQEDLVALIADEKQKITNDPELRKKFDNIDTKLNATKDMLSFREYVMSNEAILSQMGNVTKFKQEVWKSYLKSQEHLYKDVLAKRAAAESGIRAIVEKVRTQSTVWDQVLSTFRARFEVPYELGVRNKFDAVIQTEKPILTYTYKSEGQPASIDRQTLWDVLSQGERKALYILDVLFDVQVRIEQDKETLFIVDDIADSFDYRNKYAIIQYLMDIAEKDKFKLIILTHNFDFFRTVSGRFVGHGGCLIASRNETHGITFEKPEGELNVFLKVLKRKFFTDANKRLASISFMRNLVEHLRSDPGKDPDYVLLTALLHRKPSTDTVTQQQLDEVFRRVFDDKTGATWKDQNEPVTAMIEREAQSSAAPNTQINFERKVVLSIAIRLEAEKYMIGKINDKLWSDGLSANQTWKLFERFRNDCPNQKAAIGVLQSVILMTPENIHLNAFMYEPIVDMSGDHLTKLYHEVINLP